VTQLMISLALGVLIGLIGGIIVAVVPLLGLIVFPVLMVGAIYVFVKTWLVPAVIAMEGERNPIAAIKRSWTMTKGNSLRIFLFLFVLFVVAGLAVLVVNMVLTTVFAIFGGTIAMIGGGFVTSLTSAVMGGLILVVTAAIHRQLSGPGEVEAETFE